jgi:uncharacterized membrane protein AbrB (regulator of aidB expression)
MQYPFAVSFLVLFVAVILIAQSGITINNYNKTNQAKDLNYYWTIFVMVVSVIVAIAGMAGMFMNRGSAQSAAASALGSTTQAPPTVANLQAKANALQNLEKAKAEAAKAFK